MSTREHALFKINDIERDEKGNGGIKEHVPLAEDAFTIVYAKWVDSELHNGATIKYIAAGYTVKSGQKIIDEDSAIDVSEEYFNGIKDVFIDKYGMEAIECLHDN